MRLEIPSENLKDTLKIASRTAEAKGDTFTSHYMFEITDDQKVMISTRTVRMSSLVPLPGAVVEEMSEHRAFTIECRRLDQMAEALDLEAILMEHDGQFTHVKSSLGTLSFRTLDPKEVPPWGKAMAEAKPVAEVPATTLRKVFQYAKDFTREDSENISANIAQFRQGSLLVTDRVVVIRAKVPGLEESTSSMHVKDLSAAAGFLANFGDDPVKVCDHDRISVFRLPSGAVLAANKPPGKFPDVRKLLGDGERNDHVSFVVDREEMIRMLTFLSAGALLNSNRVVVRMADAEDALTLSMDSMTDDKIRAVVPISFVERREDAPKPLEGDFAMDGSRLMRVLDKYQSGRAVKLGVSNWVDSQGNPRAGWMTVVEEIADSEVTTVICRIR